MSNLLLTKEYIKQIYATGYVGCLLFLSFFAGVLRKLCGEKEKVTRYLVLMLWVMFLGAGLTIESLEATQMSWFPMLFTGVLFVKEKSESQAIQEQ